MLPSLKRPLDCGGALKPVPTPAVEGVSVHLLGDLRVERAGRSLALPASKRTRALLGYLVAVGTSLTRAHLCDLLWDGPDDPRAALRWSLTKLRPIVNDGLTVRLNADREHVQFTARAAEVDVIRAFELAKEGLAAQRVKSLEGAVALLARGEFLDGLDLPRCYRFHHWCMTERERVVGLRREVLGALIRHLQNDSERALPYARALVAADPLSEDAHATLVQLLTQVGRPRDSEAHFLYARDLLERELAAPLSGALQRLVSARSATTPADVPSVRPIPPVPDDTSASATVLVGHTDAREQLSRALRLLAEPSKRPMLLLLGEPGIGKTRLLRMVTEDAAVAGTTTVSARCFEAEMVRPYGLWADALRAVPAGLLSHSKSELAILQPESELAIPEEQSRARLFASVADTIGRLADGKPLVVTFDDIQWIDEASASLLHYLLRSLPPSKILFVCTARLEEVDDNPWAKRLLVSLDRDCPPHRIILTPLNREETAALIGPRTTAVEIESAYRESGGNPLFLLELGHARRRGSDTTGRTIEGLIDERVQRLDEAARELIAHAAVFGRQFKPEPLAEALGVPELEIFDRIERLERRGLLRQTPENHFDFAHDLVRKVIYRKLSQPRRRMMHRRIASVLATAAQRDGSLHGDLVHHAGLAEDYALAAGACVTAGNRCLRLFANSEAEAVADRGIQHLEQIPSGTKRTSLEIALLNIKVQGAFHIFASLAPKAARVAALLKEIQRAADEAEVLGLSEDAASAHNLLAWLTWRLNRSDTARSATLAAERTSRTADERTRCLHLANTGRCLLDVEVDVEHARGFLEEASTLASRLNLQLVEIDWGLGLIARWDGDLDRAHACIDRALVIARMQEDRWREFECVLWLAKIDLERGKYREAADGCEGLAHLAERVDGALAPIGRALALLARRRLMSGLFERDVEACITGLRELDDKANLSYFLNVCAKLELDRGRWDLAKVHATEALMAASAVKRITEVVTAHAVLVRVARAENNKVELARHVASLTAAGDPRALSVGARFQIQLALSIRPGSSNAHSNAGQVTVDPRVVVPGREACQSSSSNGHSQPPRRKRTSRPSEKSRRNASRSME